MQFDNIFQYVTQTLQDKISEHQDIILEKRQVVLSYEKKIEDSRQ